MANFYTDNDDIRFLFHYYDLKALAGIMEGDFADAAECDWAPADAAEAVDNYDRVLEIIGQISGDTIEPNAEAVDQEGNRLNEDGTVTRPPGMVENLQRLAAAEVMGFTLPHRFGGLNFPNLVYSISNEIISRADASLMNIYGLQGIAETINAFADESIKRKYLPGFAQGKYTGAMVLTEPDAGSDLQAIKTAAQVTQDETGQWRLHGVKRFITNGCGEVLLVLARSEPDRSGGLGLSLFVCERGPTVKIRRLENKLGIHGSPTCEIFFDNTPCELIGERQRGLVTYVMSLMNGARVGIAAQSIGIAEAAYRAARDYAARRKQFGVAIDAFPAVRELLIEMKLEIEAARSLMYETCWWVDHEYGAARRLEAGQVADKEQKKELQQQAKQCKKLAGMFTPMCKYYASEMCNRVTYSAIQVLGGSGYMKDYPVERHARDARITSIYEGTSQLQIIAAVRGVCSGAAEKFLLAQEEYPYPDEAAELVEILRTGRRQLVEAIAYVKGQPGTEYMDLHGRALVDAAIGVIVGHLFCQQGVAEPSRRDAFTEPAAPTGPGNQPATGADTTGQTPSAYRSIQRHKRIVADRTIRANAARIAMLTREIQRGDRSTITQFEALLGTHPGA
ncbi:MAG: acyl-CoA dehydrogenase family protein [Sedimentisphaerales bacterium]|nr:acyl-CoA dehydrogenase family protein [Sedimentisphaerales bacterium]